MRNRLLALLGAVAMLGFAAGGASAQPMLQLSSPSNLGNLRVGDTVRIDVDLTGAMSPAQLELLAGVVDFDPAVFGEPVGITAGPIVPNANSFGGFVDAGSAAGLFESLDGDAGGRIGGSGRFFSFDLNVAAPGSGLISLDIADALRSNPDNPLDPMEVNLLLGPGLAFNAIPEPSGLAIVGLAGLGCLGRVRRAREPRRGGLHLI